MSRRPHPFDADHGGVRRSRARAVAARTKLGPDPAPKRRAGCALWFWVACLVGIPSLGQVGGWLLTWWAG